MNSREIMSQLSEMLNDIDAVYMQIAKRHGLSYNALMMFYMADDSDQLTQKQVCDALHLPKSSVHSILSDLIRKGYMELTEGGNHKEKYIAVTEDGKALMQKINADTDKIEGNTLTSIPESDLRHFMHTTKALTEKMTEEVRDLYEGSGRYGD